MEGRDSTRPVCSENVSAETALKSARNMTPALMDRPPSVVSVLLMFQASPETVHLPMPQTTYPDGVRMVGEQPDGQRESESRCA